MARLITLCALLLALAPLLGAAQPDALRLTFSVQPVPPAGRPRLVHDIQAQQYPGIARHFDNLAGWSCDVVPVPEYNGGRLSCTAPGGAAIASNVSCSASLRFDVLSVILDSPGHQGVRVMLLCELL